MVAENRKQDIMKLLYEKKRLSVAELSGTLFVSEMTIRRDLSELEKQHLLRRYHGGAVLCEDSFPLSERFFVQEEEKKFLAGKAERYLRDGVSVYIDSSSTTLYILPFLAKYRDVTLVTNSAKALQMASERHIPCLMIGGEYYETDMCTVGPFAESMAGAINVDVAFFSSKGYTVDGVMTDPDVRQSAVRRRIMETAGQTVFLYEREKLGHRYFYTLGRKEDVTEVICSE